MKNYFDNAYDERDIKEDVSDYESFLNTSDKKEDRYDILQNKEGEILIVFNVHKGMPDKPKLITDGKSGTVLLYRHKKSTVQLECVEDAALSAIWNREEILVAELYEDEVVREYHVPVILVRDIEQLYNNTKDKED